MRKHSTEENIQGTNKHMEIRAVISYQEDETRRYSMSVSSASRVTYTDDTQLQTGPGWRGSESLTHYRWK